MTEETEDQLAADSAIFTKMAEVVVASNPTVVSPFPDRASTATVAKTPAVSQMPVESEHQIEMEQSKCSGD